MNTTTPDNYVGNKVEIVKYYEVTKRIHGHHFYIGEQLKVEFFDEDKFNADFNKNEAYYYTNKYGNGWRLCADELKESNGLKFNEDVSQTNKGDIIGKLVCLEFEVRNREYCRYSNRAIVLKPHHEQYGIYLVQNIISLAFKYENMHEFAITDRNDDQTLYKDSWQEKLYIKRIYDSFSVADKIKLFLFKFITNIKNGL